MRECPKCGHRWEDGLSPEVREGMLPIEVEWAILELWKLRKEKKYQEADAIREQFRKIKIELRYGIDFVRWHETDYYDYPEFHTIRFGK